MRSRTNTEAETVTNPVREVIAAGGIAYGLAARCSFRGELAHIARAAGYHYLYLDAQHAPLDTGDITRMVEACLSCSVAPIVRVKSVSDQNISNYLDAGALGIVAPNVDTPAQAWQLVETARFPPVGSRSFGGPSIHFDYAPVAPVRAVAALDAGILLIAMVESARALDNLDEIVAVPGISGIYVGVNDLLIDLGKAGQFDAPEVTDALDRVVRVTRERQLLAGVGGLSAPARQAMAASRGATFMTIATDLELLMAGAATQVRTLAEMKAQSK